MCSSDLLYDVDEADVKNVLMSLKVSMGTRDIDVAYFGEANIQAAVKYYIEWINYFYYQYSIDYRFRAKPVIWNERKNDAYTIQQLERGALMELYIDDEFKRYGIDIGFFYSPTNQYHGESSMGIEIKHDMKSRVTGNFYIECYETHAHCLHHFTPSGILKQSNTIFWLIGTPEEYYIVYENSLKQLFFSMNPCRSCWQKGISCCMILQSILENR